MKPAAQGRQSMVACSKGFEDVCSLPMAALGPTLLRERKALCCRQKPACTTAHGDTAPERHQRVKGHDDKTPIPLLLRHGATPCTESHSVCTNAQQCLPAMLA